MISKFNLVYSKKGFTVSKVNSWLRLFSLILNVIKHALRAPGLFLKIRSIRKYFFYLHKSIQILTYHNLNLIFCYIFLNN